MRLFDEIRFLKLSYLFQLSRVPREIFFSIRIVFKHKWLWNQPDSFVAFQSVGKNMYSHLQHWRSWLRHCATSRKVAGSIPDGVIGIFLGHNPSGRTMALGSTQPLTQVSTRDISWGGKRGRCVGLTTFVIFKRRLSRNLGAWISWNPKGLSRLVMGLLHFYLYTCNRVAYPLRLDQQCRCNNSSITLWLDPQLLRRFHIFMPLSKDYMWLVCSEA
jgi:hypothetical protein